MFLPCLYYKYFCVFLKLYKCVGMLVLVVIILANFELNQRKLLSRWLADTSVKRCTHIQT